MSPRRALIAALLTGACTSPSSAPPADVPHDLRDASEVSDVSLPDLTAEVRFPLLQERVFSAASCDVIEGCSVPGRRRLLRFDLTTPNLGPADLHLGAPTVDGRVQPGFQWGDCHGHYHFEGYAEYRLVDAMGRDVARGRKQAFCLEDTDRYNATQPLADRDRFSCSNQGIHAGWMDVYPRGLDCQYIDVTDVPPGTYRIRATVNGERRIAEARYDNNVGELTVEIPAVLPDAGAVDGGDAAVIDPTLPCATTEQGEHRDCGWDAEQGTRVCTPGAMVTVGCDPACGEPLGACASDPVLRVCAGDAICADLAALGSNDDACPVDGARNPCSRVTVTCPPSGRIRVLTGPYRAGSAYTCRVETR